MSAASLAFGMLVMALPASAATPGFHAAYFSESSFLALSPGQSGQFSVGYQNTGDQTWTKSSATSSASLHTSAPLDNTADSSTGWAQGWVAPNIYALQASDAVPPGQITYFTYNVNVPVSAAGGVHTFYGRPVIGGLGPLEDYGYYQSVSVGSTGGVTLSPASATLGIGRSVAFNVTNRPDNPGFTWSVGGGCGTVTSSGTFTATTMTTPGVACDVVATTGDGASGLAAITVYGKAASVTCSASSLSIFSNGVATSTITVSSRDSAGNLAAGDNSTVATFTNNNKAIGTLNTTSATASGGTSSVLFTASTAPGTATITASTSLGTCAVTLQTSPVSGVAHLTGTFNPTAIASDGTSTSTLTVTAADASNATLTSNTDVVRASLKTGGACTITSTNPQTLASGSTTFTIQSTKAVGDCTVILVDVGNSSIAGASVTLNTGLAGAASKLTVTSNDSPQRAGNSITIKVSLQDANGATLFSNNSETITGTPQSCTGIATQSQVVTNGVATFVMSSATTQTCSITYTDATTTTVSSTSVAITWQ